MQTHVNVCTGTSSQLNKITIDPIGFISLVDVVDLHPAKIPVEKKKTVITRVFYNVVTVDQEILSGRNYHGLIISC